MSYRHFQRRRWCRTCSASGKILHLLKRHNAANVFRQGKEMFWLPSRNSRQSEGGDRSGCECLSDGRINNQVMQGETRFELFMTEKTSAWVVPQYNYEFTHMHEFINRFALLMATNIIMSLHSELDKQSKCTSTAVSALTCRSFQQLIAVPAKQIICCTCTQSTPALPDNLLLSNPLL